MLRWLYRTLLARRATWVLECGEGENRGWMRLICFDPSQEAIEEIEQIVERYVECGWRVVVRPRESRNSGQG